MTNFSPRPLCKIREPGATPGHSCSCQAMGRKSSYCTQSRWAERQTRADITQHHQPCTSQAAWGPHKPIDDHPPSTSRLSLPLGCSKSARKRWSQQALDTWWHQDLDQGRATATFWTHLRVSLLSPDDPYRCVKDRLLSLRVLLDTFPKGAVRLQDARQNRAKFPALDALLIPFRETSQHNPAIRDVTPAHGSAASRKKPATNATVSTRDAAGIPEPLACEAKLIGLVNCSDSSPLPDIAGSDSEFSEDSDYDGSDDESCAFSALEGGAGSFPFHGLSSDNPAPNGPAPTPSANPPPTSQRSTDAHPTSLPPKRTKGRSQKDDEENGNRRKRVKAEPGTRLALTPERRFACPYQAFTPDRDCLRRKRGDPALGRIM